MIEKWRNEGNMGWMLMEVRKDFFFFFLMKGNLEILELCEGKGGNFKI